MLREADLKLGELPQGESGFFKIGHQFSWVDPYELEADPDRVLKNHGLWVAYYRQRHHDPTSVYTGQLFVKEDLALIIIDGLIAPLDRHERLLQDLALARAFAALEEGYPDYHILRPLTRWIGLVQEIAAEYPQIN